MNPHADGSLALILETALDAVVVMDSAGIVADWNSPAEAMFGWTRQEAIGQVMGDLIVPPALREAHTQGLIRYLETGAGPVLNKRIEVTALRRSGEEFPIELAIAPLDSEPKWFLGFIRDVSARRKYEAGLERNARDALLLYRVTALAADSQSADEMLRACLQAICDLTGWTIGHAFLREGNELHSTGIWIAPDKDDITVLRQVTEEARFAPGVGIPGRIMESGESLWIADVYADPEFLRARASEDLGISSAFAFPIRIKGSVIAILEFFSRTPIPPEKDLFLLSQALGDQFGRVWERLQLAEQLLEEKRRLEDEIAERKRLFEHQALILNELNHRVKNTLAVVIGIAKQTASKATSVAQFNASFIGRISALARAHGLLTTHSWRAMPLHELVREILEPCLDDGNTQISMNGPPVKMPPKSAVATGMILHELATNAAKYGALAKPTGHLAVSWSCRADDGTDLIQIAWVESGVQLEGAPAEPGFGTKLIETSARHELGGRVERAFSADGCRYLIEFPLR